MIEKLWTDVVDFFNSNFWNIILFFAVLFIGTIVVKIIINIAKRLLARSKMEGIAQGFIIAFLRIALYLTLILALLSVIGVQINGIITALSAAILAIGVALQNIISNVANGIVIVSTHMIKEGDYITVGSASGSVVNINLLFTTIATTDNRRITIPNSTLINNEVTNNGSYACRRVDFTFSVAYETDVELVKKIVIDVMKSNGKVRLDEKPPFCRLKTLGASSLDFFANCWCDNEDYWDVYYYVIENVYNEFKRNDISVPYNQLEVRERKERVVMPVVQAPLPERVEKVRAETPFDIENASFAEIIKHGKEKRKQRKEKSKQKK